MTSALTEKQAKLVEDNHNLIYTFLQKKGFNENDTEDWYGVAALGLCRAAATYDETSGNSFSTYAFVVMDNAVKTAYRDGESKNVKVQVSLDAPISNTEDYGDLSNLLMPSEEFEDYTISRVILEEIFNKLNNEEKLIVQSIIMDGRTIRETARMMNIKSFRVAKAYHKFIDEAKKQLRHS